MKSLAAVLVVLAAFSQDVEATKPAPRMDKEGKPDAKWIGRHEGFVEIAKKGGVDFLLMGDSITDGWRGGGKKVYAASFDELKPANFGIGGDRTQHVLWRLENGEIDGIKPKVTVLMIGTNNVRANTVDEIAAGITAIVKTLQSKLPETKILLLGVFPRSKDPDATRERLAAINKKIARLDDGKTVKFLDFGVKFLEDDGTISREIMPDYLHLTRKGYRIWADAMEPTLWEMLEGK